MFFKTTFQTDLRTSKTLQVQFINTQNLYWYIIVRIEVGLQ